MKALYALVGMQHRDAVDFVASLPRDEPLTLVREPTNAYDPNAIQVWAHGRHVGFVKANQARALATRMDKNGPPPKDPTAPEFDGYVLMAKLATTAERWPMIEVEE